MELFLLVIFYFFIAIILIQTVYYLFIFGKFSFGKNEKNAPKHLSVSVLVCAKNEEENLKKYPNEWDEEVKERLMTAFKNRGFEYAHALRVRSLT